MNRTRQVSSALFGLGLFALPAPASAQEAQPPRLEFAFEELATLGPAVALGETPYGNRNMIPITGGTFEGPGIKGTIVPGRLGLATRPR
jgi:hypothetical protein